ncbi:MAG: hypothetical protein A2Y10_13180 [Planctomycetes bacterium GWF2_41_51]|nr:MAG: hypothetical protein A2Y10_13180 [Planctomycetes bacterium GWF2_41_51]HBG60691.1 hypothetical protein [Candidatus Omnitrophota bacterium]
MTETEACKLLDISISASFARKQQAYRKIQRKLQLSIAPGNPQSERKKAWKQLTQLASAWHVLKETNNSKPFVRMMPKTLAQSWQTLASRIPVPEPVIVFLVIMVTILVIIGLFKL